jgi:hypothetical protein
MFDHMSRYYAIEKVTLELPDGRVVAYVRRRFLPSGAGMQLLAEVAVSPGERIDVVSNRTLGDPLAFWRICDANDAMDPQEMMDEVANDPNRRLRIPQPQM